MTQPAENTIEARAKPYIDRVENLLEEIATERGIFMERCKVIRSGIKDVYSEAGDNDLPVKPLKLIVKRRELSRKMAKLDDGMKGEDGEYDYEMLVAALGDLAELPLGQAALGDVDNDTDLRPRFKQIEDVVSPEDKPKRGRKPRSPAVEHARSMNGESPEEAEALAEVEAKGVIGAIGDQPATYETQ